MRIAVYGGTFDPPHLGHVAAVEDLQARGYTVIVVPSAGHEFKPESAGSYERRKNLARIAFGYRMLPIEDVIDPADPRRALLVLREVRRFYPGVETIRFAIGPDIEPGDWTGFDAIISEGFRFVHLKQSLDIRSTEIRRRMRDGEAWDHLVPIGVADARSK